MTDAMIILISLCSVLSVVGIAVTISKWAAVRGTEKYEGKIVDILPKYRGANYTVLVRDGKDQIKVTYYKRTTLSNSKRVGSTVLFYRIIKRDYMYYTTCEGYYNWPIALTILPWVMMVIA